MIKQRQDLKQLATTLGGCLDVEMKEVCRKMGKLDLRRFRTIAGEVMRRVEYNTTRG